jgi:hypothetical protein
LPIPLVDLTNQPRRRAGPRCRRSSTELGELGPVTEGDRLGVAHHRHVERGEEEIDLRPEVRVHGLHGYAGGACNVADPGTRPSALAEQPVRGSKDRGPRLRGRNQTATRC